MTWDNVSKAAVAVLSALTALVTIRRGRGGQRGLVKQDLELLGLLPEASTVKEQLQNHIDKAISDLIRDENEKRRDPTGIGLGIAFILIAVIVAVLAVRSGGWWLWLLVIAVMLGILGSVGLSQDASRRRRDDRGRPIREPRDPPIDS